MFRRKAQAKARQRNAVLSRNKRNTKLVKQRIKDRSELRAFVREHNEPIR